MPETFKPVVVNNVFAGKGKLSNWESAVTRANFTGTVKQAGFVDRKRWNLRLKPNSPCVDGGIPMGEVLDDKEVRDLDPYLDSELRMHGTSGNSHWCHSTVSLGSRGNAPVQAQPSTL